MTNDTHTRALGSNPFEARVDETARTSQNGPDGGLLPICKLLWPTNERPGEETEANACLIAAAPALLEASDAALTRLAFLRNEIYDAYCLLAGPRKGELDDDGKQKIAEIDKVMDQLRAAIALAKGETNADR